MILLTTSKDRLSWVETKDIDGETNLKQKYALSDSFDKYLSASVECDLPSDKIYSFKGVLTLENGQKTPLTYDNFCLRGCKLRNTEFIVGVVAYTGKETRIMRNLCIGKPKRSSLETIINWLIFI